MDLKECECCERSLPASQVPYTHSGRDGRPDVDYCQECYDSDCDLVGPCEFRRAAEFLKVVSAETLEKRLNQANITAAKLKGEPTEVCHQCGYRTLVGLDGLFVTHDRGPFVRQVCDGSGKVPLALEVTPEEMADLLKSLGAAQSEHSVPDAPTRNLHTHPEEG